MAVIIKNRVYKNPFNASSTNFLCGNVGTFLRLEFDAEVSVKFETSISESITTPSTDTIKLVSGKKWKDFGFDSGMTINIYTEGYSGGTFISSNNSVTISSIYNDVLIHNGTYDGTKYTVIPGIDNTDATIKLTRVVITATTILDACNFKYQLIKNSDSNNDTLDSVIDGTQTELQVSGLSTLAINATKPFIPLGYQSGMGITNAEIKYVSNVSGVRTYHFTIDYLITGIYTDFNDLSIFQKPDFLNGNEALTDSIQTKFFPQLNNPNVFIQNDMSWTRQLGNTGWLNENYNGLNDPFVVSNILYSIPSGNVSSLIYNQETTVQATISGLTNPSDPNLKLSFGILWATKDDTVYKSKNTNYLQNLKMNINGNYGFTNSVVNVGSGPDTTFRQGYSIDNARIDVTYVDFEVVGTDIRMTLKVVCSQEFIGYIDANPNDANYLIWVAIGDQSLNVNESNRVSKIIDFNNFEEYVTPAGVFQNMSANFLRHPHSENVGGTCDLGLVFLEDDILAKQRIAIDLGDPFLLNEVTFKIEAIRSIDELVYPLDEFSVNVSSYPIVNGVQEINYIGSRGFKYGPNNSKNNVKVIRKSDLDETFLKYYELQYGFKVRWEDWIERLNVPTAFYNTSKGKNGFNNNWFDYDSVAGWSIFYSVYLKGIKDGKEIQYKNKFFMQVYSYESNENILKTIKYYRNSDNTQLIGGYETSGKEIGIILENEYTRIEVEYELTSGVFSNDEYGTICIQVENGAGQMKFRQISTEFISENDCPLIPLQGESLLNKTYTSSNKLVLKCLIDSSLLEDAVNYRITSRLGCKQISETEDFIYTTGVNVSNTNGVNLKST